MEKEELNEEYVAILRDIRESAEQGKEFIVGQAPLVAQEIVTAKAIDSVIWIAVIGMFLLLLLAVWGCCMAFGRACWKDAMSSKNAEDAGNSLAFCIGSTAIAVFVGLFPTCELCSMVNTLAKTQYAPRVVVLEEVGKLLK